MLIRVLPISRPCLYPTTSALPYHQRQRHVDWAWGWGGLRQCLFLTAEFGVAVICACPYSFIDLVIKVSLINLQGNFPHTAEEKCLNEDDEERGERAGRGCVVGVARAFSDAPRIHPKGRRAAWHRGTNPHRAALNDGSGRDIGL